MDGKNIGQSAEQRHHRAELARRLDGIGWGAFFVWIGVAFLLELDPWIGLLGVGLITLGGQAARVRVGLPVEGFWVVVGVCFLLGAVWEQFSIALPIVPVLLVIAGIVLIAGVLRKAR